MNKTNKQSFRGVVKIDCIKFIFGCNVSLIVFSESYDMISEKKKEKCYPLERMIMNAITDNQI